MTTVAHRYAPVTLLARFQAELDRLLLGLADLAEPSLELGGWQPAMDILENETTIFVLLEVPGSSSEDLAVEVEGSLVTVRGRRTTPWPEGQDVRFHCVERVHGKFVRRLKLLWPVNSHRGRARLEDGLLILEFPKVDDKRQAAHCLPIEEKHPGRKASSDD